MKTKFILCLMMLFMITACTSFEITTEIEPKITIIDDDIGMIYSLGDIKVTDMLKNVDDDIIEFIQKEKNPIYTLHVKYDQSNNSKPDFIYYVNGIFMKKNESTLNHNTLLASMEKIDGFHLFELDGETFEEKNENTIKEKLEKIKKKVAEEKQDKYTTEESKW